MPLYWKFEISKKVEFIDAPLLEISSNQIRYLISSKKPYRYYLPFEVYKIIKEMHLYREEFKD
jgi:nicotinate-nucleotide adenylyltransferase